MIQFETGRQTLTNEGVNELLRQIRSDPRKQNPRVLGINMLNQMRARQNGYPKDLYHQTLDPIMVFSEEEEAGMVQVGYQAQYTFRDYPKFIFRRNMEEKWAPDGYVEARCVKGVAAENDARKEKQRHGVGPWYVNPAEIEPLPDAPIEDPALVIANLRGQLEAMISAAPNPPPNGGAQQQKAR